MTATAKEGRVVASPASTTADPQQLCLDKAYDRPRVEEEVHAHGDTPPSRRLGEEKQTTPQATHPARRRGVARTLAGLKGLRAIRTRCTCRRKNCLALLHLACTLVLRRRIEAIA